MCTPSRIFEYSTRPPGIQVRPEALRSSGTGSPPSSGTCHVSHTKLTSVEVKATLDPSGEKVGQFFGSGSFGRRCGSPLGNIWT